MSAEYENEDARDFEGYVDTISSDRVSGWGWYPADPEDAAVIELVDRAGTVLGGGQASLYRADLDSAGKRGGRCAFELRVPHDGPYTLRARSLNRPIPSTILAQDLRGRDGQQDMLDPRLGIEAGVTGWLDRASAEEISGWCHLPDPFSKPITLLLTEGDHIWASASTDRWRNDLVDLRQGNGQCGFTIIPPAGLFDGGVHRLELKLSDGRALTARPFAIDFPAIAPDRPVPVEPAEPIRPPADTPLSFSIIVNFHNMAREAERTLMSLSRRFQRDVDSIAYEVLCIDNGSDVPLDADFVASFGPEFRLVTPSVIVKSPCLALNEAVAQAKGKWLALMIDGAHLLSPGVLAEAHLALTAQPGGLVALRQWFVGGDQRWFSSIGYTRAQEDVLFARIDWPHRGYELFNISAPMYESPNSWLDGMSESNCLFIPSDLYRTLGGYDEAFETPGAGFANLDLFRRAVDRSDALIGLIGEASFHQYHGGVTTNTDDAEKDSRVRAYAAQYERVRGRGFVNVAPEHIRLSGSIRTGFALTSRQGVYCPARLGVTNRVRPRPSELQFDEEAQQYVQSAYVETGRHETATWRGLKVGVAPSDLHDIQEALWRTRPERIVLRTSSSGLATFVATVLPALGLRETRIMWVGADAALDPLPDGCAAVAYDGGGAGLFERLAAWIGDVETTLVILEPDIDDALPIEAIVSYSRLVTIDSYLIVLGVALGQPWLGYSRSWRYRAIQRFIRDYPGFVIDRTMNQHFVTTCPSGFLRRSLDASPVHVYDPELDDVLAI